MAYRTRGQESITDSSSSCSSSSSSSDESSDYESSVVSLKKIASEMDVMEEKNLLHHGTGLIYDTLMAAHKCDWDPNYPENPKRMTQSFQRCQELELVDRCIRLPIQYATEDNIMDVHSRELVDLAQSTVTMSENQRKELASKYDAWYCNEATYEAALAAAGSAISLTEHILTDKITNGFAIIRPPGHHAMHNEFNGYCVFNNVAIAAEAALSKGISKILIVDWDVHHGQGVQRKFYSDPRVLYFSIHRYEYGTFWPNLRESDYDHIGEGEGVGFNINIPLNKTAMTDADYMAIMNQVLLPVAYEFSPQLILISAGYDAAVGCPEFCPDLVLICNGLDAAVGDEKGEMLVTPAMYAHMVHHLSALATGRVAVLLEGGYCIKSLAEGSAMTLRALLQDPCPLLVPMEEPSDSIITSILNAIKVLRPHWKCFSHHQTLVGHEDCPYKEVNSMPKKDGSQFAVKAKEFYEIEGNYPVQSKESVKLFSDLIDKLIQETDLTRAQKECCYVFDPNMRAHRNISMFGHPERPDRISHIHNKHAEWGLLDRCLQIPSRFARKEEIALIHNGGYIEDMRLTQYMTDSELDKLTNSTKYNSIYLNEKSLESALLSCGSLLNVVEAVLTGQAQSGVANIRPPGHHAEAHCAMGFCFFNNVAIAAKFAQKFFNLKRILILDWDVHHGNATQHQFYNDPSVLYISLHRFDHGSFFPGGDGGDCDKVGEGDGEGFNVNIAWSGARMGSPEYLAAFTQIVMPIAYQYAPELVLVSAGFDAAKGDPLGGYNICPAAYGHMTHMLKGLANGRVILALEGGYNLISISACMATCTSVLLGDPCPMLPNLPPPCDRALVTIDRVLHIQKRYWPALKYNERIPDLAPPVDANREQTDLPRPQSACPAPSSPHRLEKSVRPASARLPGIGSSSVLSPSAYLSSQSARHEPSALTTEKDSEVLSLTSSLNALTVSPNASHLGGAKPKIPRPVKPQQPIPLTTTQRSNNSIEQPTVVTASQADVQNSPISSQTERDSTSPSVKDNKDSVTFKSTLYKDQPEDPDPLLDPEGAKKKRAGEVSSRDVTKSARALRSEAKAKAKKKRREEKKEKKRRKREEKARMENNQGADKPAKPSTDIPSGGDNGAGTSREAEPLEGAVGGSTRPNTVAEFLKMEGAQQMYAIQPLPSCPHMNEVKPLPPQGINTNDPCKTCGDTTENWVCLVCYQVECSRFVNEHMLYHRLETEHNMVLSYSDLSVWCYACDNYIDNEVFFPMKNAAHKSKFGEAIRD